MSNPLIIGVDGGATKTHLAVANIRGEILAVHEAGGTYYMLKDALANMIMLLQPVKDCYISMAVFTIAGWDFETDQQQQQALIEQALAVNGVIVEKAIYENDIFSTLKSAKSLNGSCVVISCGTGIIGLAADNGKFFKTPGYEYLSGEWGSGIHQAEYAIHLACASLLGRVKKYSILIEKALNYFEADDLNSLTYNVVNHFASNKQRGHFLKPVYDAYYEGCEGAAKVVNRAGEELARTIWCLLKRIRTDNVSLIFGGGVIKQFGLPPNFKTQLYQLTKKNYSCYLINNLPVYGALYWALEQENLPTQFITDRLDCVLLSS